MPNLELVRKDDVSSFRKIAIGTWRTAYDPSVYGTIELRMDEAVRYIAEFREKTGKKLTVSHLMAKAAAMVLKECPDANAILRWNRVYLRKRIGVFFQVVMTDEGARQGRPLGRDALRRRGASRSSRSTTSSTPRSRACARARTRRWRRRARRFSGFPISRSTWVLRVISFLSYTLNLDLRSFGIPQDPFGSIMITNIGTLGLDTAYVPLVPYSRVPILLAIGAVKEVPVVEAGADRGRARSCASTPRSIIASSMASTPR